MVVPDRAPIATDGVALSFVAVTDDDVDRLAPDASPSIAFASSGPGQLVATDIVRTQARRGSSSLRPAQGLDAGSTTVVAAPSRLEHGNQRDC